jgi:hypothetical protein
MIPLVALALLLFSRLIFAGPHLVEASAAADERMQIAGCPDLREEEE